MLSAFTPLFRQDGDRVSLALKCVRELDKVGLRSEANRAKSEQSLLCLMRQCGNITIALAGGIQSPILSASSVAPTEGSCTEDRLSHVTICSICETFALEEDVVVLCRNCPRTFCCACARSSAIETETPPAVMRIGPSRCGGHLETNRCPSCLHRRDEHFSAPLPGAKPMEHLVEALLKHDLSHAFRAPVDSTEYPDYVYRIGRNHMMDLQTMVEKLREGKYSSRRGRGAFKQDLNKIWRNCRFYADCDEQGVPLDETTVPGIVRCALILEKWRTDSTQHTCGIKQAS